MTSTMAQTRRQTGTILHSRSSAKRSAGSDQTIPLPPAGVIMGTRERPKEAALDPSAGPLGLISAVEAKTEMAPQVAVQMMGGWVLSLTVHGSVAAPTAPACIAPRVAAAAAPAFVPSLLQQASGGGGSASAGGELEMGMVRELEELSIRATSGGALAAAIARLPARVPVRPWLELTGKLAGPAPPSDAFSDARALLRGPSGGTFSGLVEYFLEGTLFNIVKQTLLEVPRQATEEAEAGEEAEASPAAGDGRGSQAGGDGNAPKGSQYAPSQAASGSAAAGAASGRAARPSGAAASSVAGSQVSATARGRPRMVSPGDGGVAAAPTLAKQPSGPKGAGAATARLPTPPSGAAAAAGGLKARASKLVGAAKG